MLDRAKLIAQIQQVSDSLFPDFSQEYDHARLIWQRIANDPTFIYKVQAAQGQLPWHLPLWQGRLDQAILLEEAIPSYLGLSVDGSQIYPDRHQGTGCFLINIGSVALGYRMPTHTVYFESAPHVFAGNQPQVGVAITPDYVNCLRQQFEFQGGLDLIARCVTGADRDRALFLFDGSLIFWHLYCKQEELKQFFLKRYIQLLDQLHATEVLLAGYISLPKSKELVGLLRGALCNFNPNESDAHTVVESLVDADIAQFFLAPRMRTTVFKSTSDICAEYPAHLHPYFFYLHVGNEIARIEIPGWIAQSEEAVNRIAHGVLDQCSKGLGYPVLIAEAHEQAVVKGPDRDFFYQVITKLGIERNRRPMFSAKSIKKRGIGI